MKYTVLAVALMLALPISANAKTNKLPSTQVKSVKVVDGDTVWIGLGKGKPHKVRLVGIDAPEIEARLLNKTQCPEQEKALGLRAKDRMTDLTDMSKHQITVRFHKGKDVWARNLADVYSDGHSVGQTLVSEGLAKPWPDMSQPRPTFCDAPAPAPAPASRHR